MKRGLPDELLVQLLDRELERKKEELATAVAGGDPELADSLREKIKRLYKKIEEAKL